MRPMATTTSFVGLFRRIVRSMALCTSDRCIDMRPCKGSWRCMSARRRHGQCRNSCRHRSSNRGGQKSSKPSHIRRGFGSTCTSPTRNFPRYSSSIAYVSERSCVQRFLRCRGFVRWRLVTTIGFSHRQFRELDNENTKRTSLS